MFVNGSNRMSNSHRGPSIDASYHGSVHLAKLFQSRRLLEIDQSETRIACGGHVSKWIRTKWAVFIQNLPYMLPTKFWFIWTSGFRGEDLKKSAYQKQELPVVAMFVNGSGRNEKSWQRTFQGCFLPNFDSFGLAVSEEKIFKNRPIRNMNCLWRPCLVMDHNKIWRYPLERTFHRCFLPSFSSFG